MNITDKTQEQKDASQLSLVMCRNQLEIDIFNEILKASVKQLNDFGYPMCSIDNVLTDTVYKLFCKKQLEETYDDIKIKRVFKKDHYMYIIEKMIEYIDSGT